MILELKDITASYPDGFTALKGVNASFDEKSFVVILGESGSGKTTLFKVITGLMDPSEGSVTINDKDVTNLLTESRDISMIFQNFVLYPHMTVYGNVIMGLNGFDLSNEEKDLRAKQILSEFGLSNYLNFKPRHISDGQKQRVAMCKALVREPSIFLMDEPLSNLDLPQRTRIKKELIDIYKRYETSFIYITHDLQDAEMLATVVWVMDHGTIVQTGTVKEIRKNPKTLKAFNLINGGEINSYKGTIKGNKLELGNQSYNVENPREISGDCLASFSYRDVLMDDNGPIESEIITGRVTPKGVLVTAKYLDNELTFYVNDDELDDDQIKEGTKLRLRIREENIKIFKSSL